MYGEGKYLVVDRARRKVKKGKNRSGGELCMEGANFWLWVEQCER